MHRRNLAFLLVVIMASVNSCTQNQIQYGNIAVIPRPQEITEADGYFVIDKNTKIAVENETQKEIAHHFFKHFKPVSGWEPMVNVGNEGDIVFSSDSSLKEEMYILNVNASQIVVKAASGAGFFYALQTLKQLLHHSFYGEKALANVSWAIPCVTIKDQPAFEWRGYMLDVSRHFFNVEQVKAVLDFMAELKLNRFHWHLADDQGWRLEIKSFPKLTEIGAWRVDYNTTDETVSNWFGRPKQKDGDMATYGGFYTQDDVKDIIAYAKERYIEIIPEIDMPGHAQATIAAYPEIGCVNAEQFVATGGVVKNNTYNPGKEETFQFAEKMLNEVMDLFPYKYVHIGGDECNKSQWLIDPYAQQRIKEEGLKDVHELQSYFIKRIEKIINDRDRIMIGWDEILEGGLAPNATVMSWRGEAGGIESAKAGHEVIMTPNKYCYIDLKQGHDDLEPNLGYSELLLSTAYSYKVIPDLLTDEEGKLVKGIQANMWTESISDWSKLTYMTFPRLYAIAESSWTNHKNKDWNDFTNRLLTQFKKLDAQNERYAVSAFSPWINHESMEGGIKITLKTEVNDLDIHYTLDGTEPTLQSAKYEETFAINDSHIVKARAFKNGEAVGYLSTLDFPIHKAAGKTSGELKKLTDLNYGKLNRGDSNWLDMSKHLEFNIDFEEPVEIQKVNFTALRFTISGVYPPEGVEVFGSSDGEEFMKLGETDKTDLSYIQGRNKIPFSIAFNPVKIKVLKVKLKGVDPIPQGHHTAGQKSKILIDEMVVK